MGDSPLSFGIENTGEFYHNSKVKSISKFNVNDIIGIYLDTTCEPAEFSYSINGVFITESITKIALSYNSYSITNDADDWEEEMNMFSIDVIYPCFYFKNVEFSVNFKAISSIVEKSDFYPIDSNEIKNFHFKNDYKLTLMDERKVLMMSGVVSSGKTTWVTNFIENEKKSGLLYSVIGREFLYDRYRVDLILIF